MKWIAITSHITRATSQIYKGFISDPDLVLHFENLNSTNLVIYSVLLIIFYLIQLLKQ